MIQIWFNKSKSFQCTTTSEDRYSLADLKLNERNDRAMKIQERNSDWIFISWPKNRWKNRQEMTMQGLGDVMCQWSNEEGIHEFIWLNLAYTCSSKTLKKQEPQSRKWTLPPCAYRTGCGVPQRDPEDYITLSCNIWISWAQMDRKKLD